MIYEVDSVRGFLVHTVFEGGRYISEDLPSGHTYGIGQSKEEAVQDWSDALTEHYHILSTSEEPLAPYLAQELLLLEFRLSDMLYGTSAA